MRTFVSCLLSPWVVIGEAIVFGVMAGIWTLAYLGEKCVESWAETNEWKA